MSVRLRHNSALDSEVPSSASSKSTEAGPPNDRYNIVLLTLLYTLQGVPMGLSGSVPLVLTARLVSYNDQAVFSLVSLPYSLKLLWAPIVDALYLSNRHPNSLGNRLKLGRRKSWVIPVQFLSALVMLLISSTVDELLGDDLSKLSSFEQRANAKPVQIVMLTLLFLFLYVLMATQDIAVDAWALTMLSKENVGLASSCNTIGLTAGYMISYIGFLAFNSAEFCNTWLRSVEHRSDQGMLSLSHFMFFFGVVFLVVTVYVWFCKHEDEDNDPELELFEKQGACQSLLHAYKQMVSILRLPSVLQFALVMLTCKIGFSAADSITSLKFLEKGFPKDSMGFLAVLLIPFGVIAPLLVSKATSGPRPLDVFLAGYFPRLLIGVVYALLVYFAPPLVDGGLPMWFYAAVFVTSIAQSLVSNFMFVAAMSFFSQVSDKSIGGIYMTLLNTLNNLASKWINTVALFLVDPLSEKTCFAQTGESVGSCLSPSQSAECTAAGHTCVTVRDGYYLECVVCTLIGLLWLFTMRSRVNQLQSLPLDKWRVSAASEASSHSPGTAQLSNSELGAIAQSSASSAAAPSNAESRPKSTAASVRVNKTRAVN